MDVTMQGMSVRGGHGAKKAAEIYSINRESAITPGEIVLFMQAQKS